MRGERVEVKHRIKGKAALVRSARGLLLRTHRFARGRARTHTDVCWAARAIDALDAALRVMEQPDATVSTMRSSTSEAPAAREVSR